MKNYTLAKCFGLSTLLLVSTASFAADEYSGEFGVLDTNQDGQLTATEASRNPELSRQWTKADEDESGTIDRVEFSAFESVIEQDVQSADMPEIMEEVGGTTQ